MTTQNIVNGFASLKHRIGHLYSYGYEMRCNDFPTKNTIELILLYKTKELS